MDQLSAVGYCLSTLASVVAMPPLPATNIWPNPMLLTGVFSTYVLGGLVRVYYHKLALN